MRRLILVASVALVGSCNETDKPADATRFATCPKASSAASDTPQAAYTAYARVVNAANLCQAIAFFEEDARVNVALTGFKALVIAAGAESAKQAEYLSLFSELPQHYGLPYQDRSAFVGLFLARLNDTDWLASLDDVRVVAEKDPASFYAASMRSLLRAQPDSKSKLLPDARPEPVSVTCSCANIVELAWQKAISATLHAAPT